MNRTIERLCGIFFVAFGLASISPNLMIIERIRIVKETKLKPNLLENWDIRNYWDGSIVIYGEIYNDTKKRFSDGTHIRTSRLHYIDFVERIAKTQNSIYNLGKRGDGGQ